jgi:hypothetical protein
MATLRQITCADKRGDHFLPHERISRIGGEYLGLPWVLPDYLVIYYIKNKIEKYTVMVKGEIVKVVVATYQGKEYLKAETDDYSPDSLLGLPLCK